MACVHKTKNNKIERQKGERNIEPKTICVYLFNLYTQSEALEIRKVSTISDEVVSEV